MNRLIDLIIQFLGSHTNEQWERFLVWLLMMSIVYWIILREDKNFKIGFKGSDKIWQAIEAIVYIFIYLLPGILLSNFFLGYQIDDKAMWIIEAVLLSALGIRGVIHGIKTWKNPENTTKENNKVDE